jgi:hypothetical protein
VRRHCGHLLVAVNEANRTKEAKAAVLGAAIVASG